MILAGSEEIARHPRSYERGAFVFDPLHYLALIEQKPGALDQAAPLQDGSCPVSSIICADCWSGVLATRASGSLSRCCA